MQQQKLIEKRINNIKLLIVGDGPDKENYINITRKLNIFDKVIFTGKIKQDKIQYYYHVQMHLLQHQIQKHKG